MSNKDSVLVNVPNGVFFFRDSPHYLYGLKKTVLLEELKRYTLDLPTSVQKLYDVFVKDTPGLQANIGYGSSYGTDYGGMRMEEDNKISVNLRETDGETQSVTDPFTQLSVNADVKVYKPKALITSVDPTATEITVPFTDRNNLPNVFGLNRGANADTYMVSQGFDASPSADRGVTIAGVYYPSVGNGLTLTVVELETLAILHNQEYDTYQDPLAADALAAQLLAYDPGVAILITSWGSYGEMSNTNLEQAIYQLGGTEEKFAQTSYGESYILAAIPGNATSTTEIRGSVGSTITLSPTINAAGFVPEKEYVMELSARSIKDSDGAYVSRDPLLGYSIDTTRNPTSLGAARLSSLHAGSSPIAIPVSDAVAGEYLTAGDDLFLEFPNSVYKVATEDDLPAANQASKTAAYYVSQSQTYFVVTSSGAFEPRSEFLTPTTRTVRLKVVPNATGDLYQGEFLFAEPDNWGAADFFNQANLGQLFQYLVDFWDGIPEGVQVYTNKQVIVADSLDSNVVHLKEEAYAAMDTVEPYALTQMIGINTDPKYGLTLEYDGYGKEYQEGIAMFLSDATIEYRIDGRQDDQAPVIITDLLASEVDSIEFTNEEFKVAGNKLKFNRALNKIANPSFIKEGPSNADPLLGCHCSASGVESVRDYEKLNALIHDRSAKLATSGAYVSQLIPNVDPNSKYCLSLYGQSQGSLLRIKVYEFNNGGTRFTEMPNLSSSTNVLTFDGVELTTTFKRYVARIYSGSNFSKKNIPEFPYLERPLPSLATDTTDIVVVIERVGGTHAAYIDAVQFEEASNPSYFSSDYDYAIVEYETSDLGYLPRFDISTVNNNMNSGFIVMDIESVKVNDTGIPSENLTVKGREKAVKYYSSRPWGKVHGVNKLRQSAEFTKQRIPHKGEYFLLPKLTTASSVNFLSDVLLSTQSVLEFPPAMAEHIVVINDANSEPLPGKDIALSFGVSKSQYSNNKVVKSDNDGSAKFNGPVIYNEDISPFLSVGESADSDIQIYPNGATGYTLEAGEYVMGFNLDGSYGPVMVSSGGMSLDGSTQEAVDNDWGFDPILTPDVTDYFIRTKEPGFITLPSPLPYDPNPVNSGSSVVTYFSGLNNVERQPSLYNSEAVTSNATATFTRAVGDNFFDLSSEATFTPLRSSVKVSVDGRPLLSFKESSQNDGLLKHFFIDYENKRIYIADQTITSITVSWKIHPVRLNGREVHLHRSVLFNILSELYNDISQTAAKIQHQHPYIQEITDVIEPINPLTFDLFIKLHVNIDLYVKARHKGYTDAAVMTYQHRKPLI